MQLTIDSWQYAKYKKPVYSRQQTKDEKENTKNKILIYSIQLTIGKRQYDEKL